MKALWQATIWAAISLCLCGLSGRAGTTQKQKDYLTGIEADKIRNAASPNERISLFLSFADDRLKKVQYELEHPSETKHEELLNSLLNAYVGCVDDAADLIQLGIEKQENIRKGIDLMAERTKDFLAILQKIPTDVAGAEMYKDTLTDAIEGTQDAQKEAEAAKKNVAPAPVRRKK
ncbi:MAG TPA: hypothetical protein VE077_17550 [Candidatus Methylomirabilis sp.]|nr:hypothetical protein [Candidatus Methylomirabilis sp.]